MLVVAAGLLVRSLAAGDVADPGFAPDRLAAFTFNLGADEIGPEAAMTLEREVTDALRSVPGVDGVVRTPVPMEIPRIPCMAWSNSR